MADERISVSRDSFESVRAYIEASKRSLDDVKATSTIGRHRLVAAKNDLGRALECWNEAVMTDEEVREAH